jgi:uncharacterized protein YggE
VTQTEPRTLVVTGFGTAHGTPDLCIIHLALNAMADTAASALDQVADLATRAVQVLRDRAVESSDIQTVNISLGDFHEKQRVTARVASYSMAVKLRALEEAGPVLASLSEIAGDSLQVHRMQLAASDPEVLQTSARRDAVVDATGRAKQLAEAAGVTLGPILEIREGQAASDQRLMARGVSFAAASSMPVEGGEVTSTVAVTVTYAIED